MSGKTKTFEFETWDPKNETKNNFCERTTKDFEEYLDEVMEATQTDGGGEVETVRVMDDTVDTSMRPDEGAGPTDE